jgi:RNA-binding protein YlmH
VASLRLDALVSTAVRVSREKASQLVKQGLVSVSGAYDAQPASILDQGQVFSVRGYGRFILDTVGNETKKGRIHIKILKYL